MAITGKKIGRGLAAGLVSLGQGLKEKEIREEEQRRFEETSARQERELQLREQESRLRQEQMELSNTMKRVQFNNQQMNAAIQAAQYEPAATGQAITQFGPTGEGYDYDPIRSKEVQLETNNPEAIVYKRFKYEKTADGRIATGPDGKFVKIPFPGTTSEKVLANKNELVDWTIGLSNPEHRLATAMAGIDAETLHNRALEFETQKAEAQAKTPQGRARLGLVAAQEKEALAGAKLKEAQAGLAGKKAEGQLKPEAEITTLTGETKKLGKEEAQNARKTFEKASKNITSLTSIGEAARINETKDNPQIRKLFASDIQAALQNPAQAEGIKRQWVEDGLNAEYFDQVLAAAQLESDLWTEAEAARTPNLLQKTINKIFGAEFGTGK